MAIQTVQHIADVSFRDHFLSAEVAAPVNGKIKVNHNTFDVTFRNGIVRAKFASGNAFTNWFRSDTLNRFTRRLQAQYNAWCAERLEEAQGVGEVQAPAEPEPEQALGFEDNPDAPRVAAVVDEFRAVLKEVNPPGMDQFMNRLDSIAALALIRNTLTQNPSASACNDAVKDAGFLTHFYKNTNHLDERGKKGYVLNMLDSIINGFLQAASQMKDKKVQVVDLLRNFDGACLEAKSDNIQDWLARAAGIANAARSDSSHDLAYSATLELEEIAKEVRRPFEDEARKACEAEVRADCEKKGVTDEAEIKDKIDARVASILAKKEGEIAPKIREAIMEKGKLCLYTALAGAMRPVTEIAKDLETGKWVVTTLVDKAGNPVLKPVSAYDIDRNFDKMVEMFMEDAVVMNEVENRTVVEEPVYATREDYRRDGVIAKMDEFLSGKADVAELVKLVKAELSYDPGLSDEELRSKVEKALADLAGTKKDDEVFARKSFCNFVNFYADGSYMDKKDDLGRLVHLLARHTETMGDKEKMCKARIEKVSARCAQMMANAIARHGYDVDVVKLQGFVGTALGNMVREAFAEEDTPRKRDANSYLRKIIPNGVLFADSPVYEVGHRAAGENEKALTDNCKVMVSCIKKFAGVLGEQYMTKIKG